MKILEILESVIFLINKWILAEIFHQCAKNPLETPENNLSFQNISKRSGAHRTFLWTWNITLFYNKNLFLWLWGSEQSFLFSAFFFWYHCLSDIIFCLLFKLEVTKVSNYCPQYSHWFKNEFFFKAKKFKKKTHRTFLTLCHLQGIENVRCFLPFFSNLANRNYMSSHWFEMFYSRVPRFLYRFM